MQGTDRTHVLEQDMSLVRCPSEMSKHSQLILLGRLDYEESWQLRAS